MFQLWVDDGGSLRPIAKFGSLEDALDRVAARSDSFAFAIQFPNGEWYRDGSGRTMLRAGARRPAVRARGSRPIDVSAFRTAGRADSVVDHQVDDEPTDVRWPPDDDPTDVRWPPDDGPTAPTITRSKIFG